MNDYIYNDNQIWNITDTVKKYYMYNFNYRTTNYPLDHLMISIYTELVCIINDATEQNQLALHIKWQDNQLRLNK